MQGDSVVRHPGNQRARNDKVFTGLYAAWNCAQFARNRRDVLQQHPEYNQCWFSQQAEWNLYSYQCSATIDHLPFEYRPRARNAAPSPRLHLATPPGPCDAPSPWRPPLPLLAASPYLTWPHALARYKLLWHNSTIDHPFLSNCNLPSICGKCRGRDGAKRPTADLMANEPCGFCRCGSDMRDASSNYITLPAEMPKLPEATQVIGPDGPAVGSDPESPPPEGEAEEADSSSTTPYDRPADGPPIDSVDPSDVDN